MRIKRLEIQGFKSFADRTVLHFGDGITGVVGPNGCGKSNIVDALRWAMGEQSAKHLRGDGMSDVIFAGSESRGAMGFAEVTLTFKNDDGTLVPVEYRELSEISVTRRLFRDGTSEYLLNRQPARLRDVVDLFLGTGVGTKSYSIIEQGRIGLVVTAKPEDRRALIEDAAGITKYKARRKQAERRLEAAEQNLLRVSDVVAELVRRMASLERQAKKAERYKEAKTELKRLELWAAAHRGLELTVLADIERQKDEVASAALREAEAEVAASETALATHAEEREGLATVVEERRRRLAEIEQLLAVGAKNLEHLGRERAGLVDRRTQADRELGVLIGQLDAARAEREELFATGAALDAASEGEGEVLERAEAELEAMAIELKTAGADAERLKQSVFDVTSRTAEQRNQLGFLARRAADLDLRRAGKAREAAEALAVAERLGGEAREAASTLERERLARAAVDDSIKTAETELEGLHEEFMGVEARALALRGELLDKRARHASLVEIQRNYEGCQEGVRAVMRHAAEDPALASRVRGLVADVLVTPPELEVAVEAALGDRLQYVVVEDQEAGALSIARLKESADGRSTFIPLDLREDHVSWAPRKATRRPVPSDLVDLVAQAVSREAATSPPRAPMWAEMEAHFERHASSAPRQLELGALAPEVPSLITEASASLTPRSISDRPPPAEVLELVEALRAAELTRPKGETQLPYPEPLELADVWPNLEAQGVRGKLVDLVKAKAGFDHVARVLCGDVVVVEDLATARAIWRDNGHRKTLVTLGGEVLDPIGVLSGGSSSGSSAGLLAKKREIAELEVEIARLEGVLAEVAEQRGRVEERIAVLEDETRALAKQRHEGDLGIVKLEQDVERLENGSAASNARKAAVDGELASLDDERLGVERERGQADHAIGELDGRRVELEAQLARVLSEHAAAKARADALAAHVTDIKVDLAAKREKREAARRSLERADQRVHELVGRIARIEENLDLGRGELERIDRELADSARERATHELDAADRRDALQTLEAELTTKAEVLRQADEVLRAARRRLDETRAASLGAQLRLRELDMERQALRVQIEERYQADLEALVGEHHLLPAQSEADTARIAELKKRIDAMGEINLMAIEEYEEARARHEFLVKQKSDLDRAIDALKQAIKKINATSQARFAETFALVNEKFQQVFPRLFHGGKASLELSDPSDPHESGVEMLAQPPGKKLQSVSLLSGGEKALTAVALIFSIFLIKPTPFCLLDEVDAPLDDANVGRYNELIRDMSSISQFIVITHNKRTMEVPDRLFGVTMEEPGISKLVSVDIKSTEESLRRLS